MRHIKWVLPLAALCLLAVPLNSAAKGSSCGKPDSYGTMKYSKFRPSPGQLVTYTFVGHPTCVDSLTVTLMKLSPQLVLVKSKTTRIVSVDEEGHPTWTWTSPKDPTTMHFTVRVKPSVQSGTLFSFTLNVHYQAGDWNSTSNFRYKDHAIKK